MLDFRKLVEHNPTIAAIREPGLLQGALASRAAAIFMLSGDLASLAGMVQAAHDEGKPIFLHLDLVDGLGRDKAAVKFLAQEIRPDGVITTRSHLIKYAKEYDLYTVQRIFVLDSLSLKTGIHNVRATAPHAVECLPGIMPGILGRLAQEVEPAVIAGGLVRSAAEVKEALAAGAVAVSTSEEELW